MTACSHGFIARTLELVSSILIHSSLCQKLTLHNSFEVGVVSSFIIMKQYLVVTDYTSKGQDGIEQAFSSLRSVTGSRSSQDHENPSVNIGA